MRSCSCDKTKTTLLLYLTEYRHVVFWDMKEAKQICVDLSTITNVWDAIGHTINTPPHCLLGTKINLICI